jgi:hypothetical protein
MFIIVYLDTRGLKMQKWHWNKWKGLNLLVVLYDHPCSMAFLSTDLLRYHLFSFGLTLFTKKEQLGTLSKIR